MRLMLNVGGRLWVTFWVAVSNILQSRVRGEIVNADVYVT